MKKTLLVALSIFALIATACAPAADDEAPTATASPDDSVSSDDPQPTFDIPTPEDPAEFEFGEAQIDDAQVLILESFPVQVNVQITGNLSDGCTELHRITSEREDDTFYVTVETIRPVDQECTEALVPFTEVTSLDVNGLPAGEYTVDVNGFTTSFELQMDNVSPEGMDSGGDVMVAEAPIDDVEVVAAADDTGDALAVQISGSLTDACTELGEITDEYDEDSNTIRVTVLTERPSDMICAQVIEPFSTTYELTAVPGPGDYTLSVNGVESELTVEE